MRTINLSFAKWITKKIRNRISTPEQRQILHKLEEVRLTSRRVVGRGTLTLDVQEATSTERFKQYVNSASSLMQSKAS